MTGLSVDYATIATLIKQSNPLPSFYKARSMLLLVETRRSRAVTTGTALVASKQPDPHPISNTPATSTGANTRPPYGRGKGNKGGCSGGGRGRDQYTPHPRAPPTSWMWLPYNPWGQVPNWTPPPCPYPTSSWTPRQPSTASSSPSILGPRPQQAFVSQSAPAEPSTGKFVPTDIVAAMQTLSLQPPDDNWYMDTGATSHMMADQGILSSYSHSSLNNNIIVGSGHTVPIKGFGHTLLPNTNPPLTLNKVLHAPKLTPSVIMEKNMTTSFFVVTS